MSDEIKKALLCDMICLKKMYQPTTISSTYVEKVIHGSEANFYRDLKRCYLDHLPDTAPTKNDPMWMNQLLELRNSPLHFTLLIAEIIKILS